MGRRQVPGFKRCSERENELSCSVPERLLPPRSLSVISLCTIGLHLPVSFYPSPRPQERQTASLSLFHILQQRSGGPFMSNPLEYIKGWIESSEILLQKHYQGTLQI